VPEKHFFSVQQVQHLSAEPWVTCELVYPRVERFKSNSNFVVRGTKHQDGREFRKLGVMSAGQLDPSER